ncbi:hypothetical protein K2173_023571 [Erythroxylum novogranatense]|uniref:Protein SPEAR1-like n=1 Tax=Erythroxylum novogranatense TaxID=1862640 RepID=A0AAV8TNX4_9ROSI|nr:hypothetical protein K2173_023571 [Erythroxylum novogranatense]
MSSRYCGEPNLVHERGGSSRKGKKSNSDKPKQPQRGLGVAQLEKIRLHGQMESYHPSLHALCPTNFNQVDMEIQGLSSSIPSSSFSYSSLTSASYGYPSSIMMGIGDCERSNIRYGDSLASTAASWNPRSNYLEREHFAQPRADRHILNSLVEDSKQKKNKKLYTDYGGSRCQNSESSDSQELDLELRLSI